MISKKFIVLCCSLVSLVASASAPPPKPCYVEGKNSFTYPQSVANNIEAKVIASDLKQPRSLAFDDKGRLIVVELGAGLSVFTYSDDDKATCKGWEKSVLAGNQYQLNLTHGLAVRGSHVYASSEDKVYRWDYDVNTGTVTGAETVVVDNMPTGGHNTRTLVLYPRDPTVDAQYLIVHAGSLTTEQYGTVDYNVSEGDRPAIRSFQLSQLQPKKRDSTATAAQWQDGHLVAAGLRDAVGMSFGIEKDSKKLWVTENSYDEISNAADELDLIPFDPAATTGYYGFSDCYALWTATDGQNPGTQVPRNAYLKNPNCGAMNGPSLIFAPHSAPHGLAFYEDVVSSTAKQALPNEWKLGGFIPFRGLSAGFGIGYVAFDKKTSNPVAKADNNKDAYQLILSPKDPAACPDKCLRPTGVAFQASEGRLFGTSDETGELFVLQSVAKP